jgi:hypothetical protein
MLKRIRFATCRLMVLEEYFEPQHYCCIPFAGHKNVLAAGRESMSWADVDKDFWITI